MTNDELAKKDAAQPVTEAAKEEKISHSKLSISSCAQALAKLELTATDFNGTPTSRSMPAREWRRWKSANLNILAFVERDLEKCLLLTVTTPRITEKLFRKRLKNFCDRRLRQHVVERISVFELQ